MRNDFSKILKEQRKSLNLTQKDLADKTGLSEITIRKYEKGERQPKLEQLQRLSKALECDILDFMSAKEQNLFYLNESQRYLNKVLSSENHPATPLVDVLLSIITHISDIAPVNSTEFEEENIEYLNLIEGVLSQLNDSLFLADDTFEDYKILMKSIEKFIKENYREYFLQHHKGPTTE